METKDILKIIRDEWSKGNIAYYDGSGIVSTPVEELVKQPADGLLYDLNRDVATTTAVADEIGPRYINDLAMAHVVEYLMDNRK